MATVNPMLERAARAVASRRIAYDFGYPAEHEMVQKAVDARWKDYADEARDALVVLIDPDDGMFADIKGKDRAEAVAQWNAMLAAIVG